MADAPEIEALTPYARSLGISLDRWEDGTPILTVPFDETVEGLRRVVRMSEEMRLPSLPEELPDDILHRDTLPLLGLAG